MDSPGLATGPVRRPGGRTARTQAQVHEAVLALLVEQGFDGLTIDAVADRSGVHRTTVYRRWHDVGGLLADVLTSATDDGWTPEDTGSLAGDLLALNRELHDALTAEQSITMAVIAASFRSEQAAVALQQFWADRYARSAVVVERAIQRQEISPRTDSNRLLIAATAPLYHYAVLMRVPLDAQLADQCAHDTALAAVAGAFG